MRPLRAVKGERGKGRLAGILTGLFTPRATLPVAPPRPRTPEQYVRTIVGRTVITQILSGPDTTLVEKAAFVFGPDVAVLAARRGATIGHGELWSSTTDPTGRPPGRPGSIDI